MAEMSINTNTSDFPSADSRWYTVTVGKNPGVHQGWYVTYTFCIRGPFCLLSFRHTVHPLVSGVGGACYQRHATPELARAAFREAYNNGQVVVRY